MANARNTKKALLMSALSLVLCISMLVGTTFAWFTDSVTSANNIIASGNLDVEMYWAKGTEDPANATWIDASTGAIFNYDKWEPGYVEVRHIKIANVGSLALKYKVNMLANGTVSELADVIDVYYMDPADQIADRTELTDANKIGTLTEVLAALGETGNGTLAAGAIDTITIALKMQESAGNEYQNKSIGTDFSIQLLAAQYTAEDDSFDDQYDAEASYRVTVSTPVELQNAINNAEPGTEILLEDDFTVNSTIVIPASNTPFSLRAVPAAPAAIVIDLNGNVISADDATYAFNNLGNLILKDSVGTGSINARGIYNGYGQGGENVSNARLTVENVEINALGTTGGAAIYNYGIVEIRNGEFTSNGGYALNNQASGKMTVSDSNAKGGIYNVGDLTVNNATVFQHISGRHAIYNWTGSVVINGGNYDSISGNELILADGTDASVVINDGTFNKTAKSWLFGAATGKNITFTINGGVFKGYVNLPENTVDTIRPYNDPIVVYGGTFNFNPTNWLVDGYKTEQNADGMWDVSISDLQTIINNAAAGDTILLTSDVEASTVIVIDKSLTIEGNGHKLASTANRVFRLTTSNIEVTLNDVNMVSNAVRVSDIDIRGISLDPSLTNVELTLNDCSVDFTDASAHDWSYAVNIAGNGTGHTVVINGGTYEGANVINANGVRNTIVVKNATLSSLYQPSPYPNMYGACIYIAQDFNSSLEATGNTFNGINAMAINVGYTPYVASNNVDNTVLTAQ